jgi:hypothetical protein
MVQRPTRVREGKGEEKGGREREREKILLLHRSQQEGKDQ